MDLTTFRTQFPEFAEMTDTVVSINLGRASLLVNGPRWGALRDEAIALLTAHELTVRKNEFIEYQNKLAANREGEVLPPYLKTGLMTQSSSYWDLTAYGARFREIRKTIPKSGFVI